MEFNATFILCAVSFVLFTAIMNKIFYKPIENIIYERKKFINDNLSDAKKFDEQAESLIKDKEEKLNKSALDAKQLINDRVNDANLKSKDITLKAKQKSQTDIDNAKLELLDEARKESDEINLKVDELADIIIQKVVS